MLNITETGIYYIYDYYPRRSSQLSFEQTDIRYKIWDYKNLKEEAINKFANDIIKAVRAICKDNNTHKIGLVAVPPSKVKKKSPVKKSIRQICDWYTEGLLERVFGFNKAICDYGELLTRSYDIPTSHEGIRSTYRQQMDSLTCNKDLWSEFRTIFILIDDVTTRGTTMRACKDVLVENGAGIVYCLAIARTVSDGVHND